MAKNNETIGKTFSVVLILCLVCSVIVSGAAVGLKDLQQANAAQTMQRHVLSTAGIELDGQDVANVYSERVREFRLNLETYELIEASEEDLAAVAAGESESVVLRRLSGQEDIAGIRELERQTMFYIAYAEDGETVQSYVFQTRGLGLWGMMHALVAVENDGSTIRGINFYDHGETPGLGGEIQNPRWRNNFIGKTLVDESGQVQVEVAKGASQRSEDGVDALSGATITSNGVDNIFQFWFSDAVYGPFLAKLREGEL